MERELIARTEISTTQKGKPVADLFSTDARLQFPVLRLFDLSMLETVGIDPNLAEGDSAVHRFWAYYTESDKLNAQGNPYRDVEYLEQVDTPATATSVDGSAALGELRAIRALLVTVAQTLGVNPDTGELPARSPALMSYGNGNHVGDNQAEQQAFVSYLAAAKEPPTDRDSLRAWFLSQD